MTHLLLLGDEAVTSTMGSELNTALTQSVTGSTILSQFKEILPWVGIMVGAAFLIYEAKKMLKGAAKAKVRL